MQVTLLDYTGKGRPDESRHAQNLLAFTKTVRLGAFPERFESIQAWSEERIAEELAYMATTIRSSWEFVDLTFVIQGVTRAAAQQITRTRTASYAMQSLRVANAKSADVRNDVENETASHLYQLAAKQILHDYEILMTKYQVPAEQARGLLPLNIETNLVAKYNLRSWVDLVVARSSSRVQGEYREMIEQMRAAVLAVWPWVESFLQPPHEMALGLLQEAIDEAGLDVGEGLGWKLAKAADLIRGVK
jgi:flavin-dependent thymidylate synthase